LDPGLGKTSITLAALKILIKKKLTSKILVIAPLRVCHSVWPAEIKKWKDFKDLKCVVLHGPKKDELLKQEADIYIINPEGLDWLIKPAKAKTPKGKVKISVDVRKFKALGFDTLVVDELSKFKHHGSQRFKMMKEVLKTFARRWGLTGSPASNGLMGLFGQCYMLDTGRTFGKYITQYRSKYFDKGHDGFSWKLKEGADTEIYKALKPLALRMSADDYLEMPKLIQNNIMVELPPKARAIYDRLEADMIVEFDGNTVTAVNAAVLSGKCRQVASGGIYLNNEIMSIIKGVQLEKEWANVHNAKTEALVDLVDELQGSPLLVAYDYKHDLDRIQKAFGGDIPYIGSGVSVKKSKIIEDDWNAGKIPLLLGHPQSIGHGLNLQESGQHVAFYSMIWDYETYDQFIRRVLRQGNKHKRVFLHHIMAEDTIDQDILNVLIGKRLGQNALFDAIKSLVKRRK